MGQRTKAMDTESPTSKFLYAIIKQLDLKIVDWNTVARDLAISNGHAARMRYSRFKSQIDPSTSHRNAKKKNPKKVEKGTTKGDMSMSFPARVPFQMNNGCVPKQEPTESQCHTNPFVKCESGGHQVPGNHHLPDGLEIPHQLPQTMTGGSMAPPSHMSQYVTSDFPFAMVPAMAASMSFSSPSPFAPYPTRPLSQDSSVQDFGMQSHMFSTGPVITWEPPATPSYEFASAVPRDSIPVPVKEEREVVERKIDEEVPIKIEKSQQAEQPALA